MTVDVEPLRLRIGRIDVVADRCVIHGQEVWISRVRQADLMILLARTTPLAQVRRKSEGMSVFIVDLRQALGNGLSVRPIANMVDHETHELFFDGLEIPAENPIGAEGQGFGYILDGYSYIERARRYANERIVFDRPIGRNQGVQFPIADAFIEVEAANPTRFEAARRFDAHPPCGAQASMARLLAAKASWEAANVRMQRHGGFGFASEHDIGRKFRETRRYRVAPISTHLICACVAEHVLALPRSF
jgi:acyl-CoA dehydrogenase